MERVEEFEEVDLKKPILSDGCKTVWEVLKCSLELKRAEFGKVKEGFCIDCCDACPERIAKFDTLKEAKRYCIENDLKPYVHQANDELYRLTEYVIGIYETGKGKEFVPGSDYEFPCMYRYSERKRCCVIIPEEVKDLVYSVDYDIYDSFKELGQDLIKRDLDFENQRAKVLEDGKILWLF